MLERGLAVDPAARWPTMVELLDALARDPSRRRRGFMLGASLVALTGVALAGGLVWHEREQRAITAGCEGEGQAIESDWNDEVAARLERAFVATGVGFAASAWAHSRPWIDDYTRAWSQLRTRTCLETHREHTRDRSSHDSIVDCLDEQRTTLGGLLAAWAAADRRTITGATVAAAGLTPLSTCTSELLARRALAPPSLRVEVAALRARLEHVRALHLAGAYDQGLALTQEILAEADNLAWRPLRAEAWLLAGTLHADLGKYEAARDARQQAFFHALAGGDDPGMLAAATDLAHNVGYQLALPEQGRQWGTIGEMLIERLGLAGTLREATLVAAIAGVQTLAGDYDEALRYFRRALASREALLGPNHPSVARMLNSVGVVLFHQGAGVEALACFRRSLAIEEAALGPDHPDVAYSLNNLAAQLGAQGMLDEALEYHHRALAIRISALGPEHPDVAVSLSNLGELLTKRGDHAGALDHERRALAILEAALGREHPEVAETQAAIGRTYLAQQQYDQALVSYRAALAIREATLEPDHPLIGESHHDIGRTQLELGAEEPALASFHRALAIREVALGRDNPEVGRTLVGIARAQLGLGERAAARESLERAAAIGERANEPALLAEARQQLARLDEPPDPPGR